MKKQLYILAIGFIALASSSCNDFLDREPLDSVPTSQYLFNENDLSAYTANMYGIFPVHAGYGLGTFDDDNDSDNQAGSSPNDLFVKGQTRVAQNGGDWDFGNIRTANYFINTVRPRLENGEIENSANNNHWAIFPLSRKCLQTIMMPYGKPAKDVPETKLPVLSFQIWTQPTIT